MAATVGTVVILALIFHLLGRRRSTAGTAGAVPRVNAVTTRVEGEGAALVQDDMRQMLAAQNALREKRGAPAMTIEDLRAAAAEDERNRSRGRGPFAVG